MVTMHLTEGEENKGTCNICNEQVDSPKSTLIHFLKHRITWHICTCGRAFQSEPQLLEHRTNCVIVGKFCDRCVSHLCTCISDLEYSTDSESDAPQNRWWDSEEDISVRCKNEDHTNHTSTNT